MRMRALNPPRRHRTDRDSHFLRACHLGVGRERGTRAALMMAAFITAYAFGIGILMNFTFRFFSVTL